MYLFALLSVISCVFGSHSGLWRSFLKANSLTGAVPNDFMFSHQGVHDIYFSCLWSLTLLHGKFSFCNSNCDFPLPPIKIKSVIRQTKETSNVHPMCRDLSPRRKLGPAIFHKTVFQDRLIEELQDRLGISKPEQEEWRSQDNWLTEGVIIISRPQKNEQDGGQQVEKVGCDTWCVLSLHRRRAQRGFLFCCDKK